MNQPTTSSASQPEEWRRRWNEGEPFGCSSGIAADEPTYGYGHLHGTGYWEFPVPVDFAEAHAAENRARWEQLRAVEERAYDILDRAFGRDWRCM